MKPFGEGAVLARLGNRQIASGYFCASRIVVIVKPTRSSRVRIAGPSYVDLPEIS